MEIGGKRERFQTTPKIKEANIKAFEEGKKVGQWGDAL